MQRRAGILSCALLLAAAALGADDDPKAPTRLEILPLPNGAAMRLGPPPRGHVYGVAAIAVQGESIVSAGFEGCVHFWDRKSGAHRSVIVPPKFGDAEMVRLAPDGIRMVWTAGGRISLCRLKPLERPFVPLVVEGRLDETPRSMSFESEGHSAVWNERRGVGLVFDTNPEMPKGAVLRKVCQDDADLVALGGTNVALASGRRVTLKFASSYAEGESFEPHGSRVTALWFARNEKTLATGAESGEFALWRLNDAVTAIKTKTLATPVFVGGKEGGRPIRAVATSRDGRALVVVDERRIRLVDAKTGDPKVAVFTESEIECWALSEDSRTLAAGVKDVGILVWDVKFDLSEASAPRVVGAKPSSIDAISFVDAGTACADENGTIRTFAPDGAATAEIGPDGAWRALALSRDGSALLRTDGKSVRLDRRPSGEVAWTVPLEASLPAAFSPDGTRVAVEHERDRLVVLDAATGKEVARTRSIGTWFGSGDAFGSPGLVPEAVEFVAADGTVRVVVPAKTGAKESSLVEFAATPDGRIAATYDRDEGFVIHRDGRADAPFIVPSDSWTGFVSEMRLDDEGKRLAVATSDGDVLVFDVAARKLASVFHDETKLLVTSLAFVPGTSRIASGSTDGTVLAWDAKLVKR